MMRYVDTDTGELYIPEFAHGYLLAYSLYFSAEIKEAGEDVWEQVMDVPILSGEHCDYQTYDLHFWHDDIEGIIEWHCTAYEVWYDEANEAHTKVQEYRRLW